MQPVVVPVSIAPPVPVRSVYLTVRCPGCGSDATWLAMFDDPNGGTRYAPGMCLCSLPLVA